MKHKLTFLAVLLMTALTMSAVAQNRSQNLKNPDEATYAITGNMQSTKTSGNTSYELLNPQGSQRNGGYIKFKQLSHYYGTAVDGEQVRFSLENAETNRPGKFSGNMVFWSWNDEAEEWQIDMESGSGRSEYESASYVNFMLVLDCSGSMQNELTEMKNSAKYFLRKMLDVSGGKGNVRIGVIGFSTVEYSQNHTQDPLPLTRENCDRLCNYIDRLNDGGGTALWYSLNAAARRLQMDYDQNLRGKRYAGAAVVAFTDGHDNTSNDETYTSSKEYYNYTLSHFPSQTVNGLGIASWIVGLRGGDITSDNIWNATIGQFRKVAGQFIPISRIDELHDQFDKIAEDLIERNTVLNLRVAKGISGRVGWTFPEEKSIAPAPKPRPDPKPRKQVKIWMGIGLEGGVARQPYEKYRFNYADGNYYLSESGMYNYPFGGIDVGVAFNLSSRFGLGATASLTYCSEGIGYGIGPLAKITFDNDAALLASFGIKSFIGFVHPYLSLGWKFSGPWYITAFTAFNDGVSDFGFGVGYSIIGGKK